MPKVQRGSALKRHAASQAGAAAKMDRTSTILPPPSDIPVPMPEPAGDTPDSGEWRTLVELTKETVRPGARRDGLSTKETVRPGAEDDENGDDPR